MAMCKMFSLKTDLKTNFEKSLWSSSIGRFNSADKLSSLLDRAIFGENIFEIYGKWLLIGRLQVVEKSAYFEHVIRSEIKHTS